MPYLSTHIAKNPNLAALDRIIERESCLLYHCSANYAMTRPRAPCESEWKELCEEVDFLKNILKNLEEEETWA